MIPTLAVFIAVVWVVRDLPKVYESTTLLTITPPKISEKVAPSLTDDDMTQRLQSISQAIVSRSSLEPMIVKYGLYSTELASGTPMDRILEKMKSRIMVDLQKSDDRKVLGFRISYRDRDPEITQKITAEIAGKFVTAQNAESTLSAETTREFIENQMGQAKSNLDALEKQRLDIMTENVDTLPDSVQGLIAQLSGLRGREQNISKEKETLTTEKGRIEDSIRDLNSQIRLIESYGDKDADDSINRDSRVEDTPAYGQLIQRRAELNGKLENLKKQYRDKHPDIIQTQIDINKINDELEKLTKTNDQRAKQAMQASARKAELQKKSLESEIAKAQRQIEQIEQQFAARDQEIRSNAGQIAAMEAKINTIPNVKVALESVSNQYQSAKSTYDELLKKFNNAQQQVQVETDAQGETIRVIDPANLPQIPVNASKKPMFIALGAAIGLALGLGLAAAFEAPKFFKVQNIADAEHYTGLPVLGSIPPLLTEKQISKERRSRLKMLFAGTVAGIASVPLLIMALHVTQIFERFS